MTTPIPSIHISLFELGSVFATPGAIDALAAANQTPIEFLRRHAKGDWGDLDSEDKQTNRHALTHGYRLLSAYRTSSGDKIWIITEADRSVTTILLPDEY